MKTYVTIDVRFREIHKVLIKEKKKKRKGAICNAKHWNSFIFDGGITCFAKKKKELIVLRRKSEKCLFKNGTKKYLS